MLRLVLIMTLFTFGYIIDSHAQLATYYPNPGRGYMTSSKIMVDKVANIHYDNHVTTHTANHFKYVYLNEIFTNECISPLGILNETALYHNIKTYFDKFLNKDAKGRFIIRIFPNNEGNNTRLATLVEHSKAEGRHIYTWLPTNLYALVQKSSYPTLVGRAIYPKYFTKCQNVAIVDYRNPLIFKVYDTVLRVFAMYLNEEIQAPVLMSSTNMPMHCKRGDLIYCIEMGFVGSWGEGITTDYSDYKSSKPLIRIAELYKKYLADYWLIAPSYGMRSNTTKNPAIYEFQYYLLTTTYGSRLKNIRGFYIGKKEFGLFMDHLGSSDYLNDFDLSFSGQSLKEIAKKKYVKAPFIGENNGQFNKGKDLILQNISDYGVSLANLWNAIPLDSITNDAEWTWKEAANCLGYSFYVNMSTVHKTNIKNGKLSVYFTIENRGSSKFYGDFWLPQLVIRDKDNNVKQIININSKLDLQSILPMSNQGLSSSRIIQFKQFVSRQFDGMKIYLRFVDRKHINENMYVINQPRTDYGEYLLGF